MKSVKIYDNEILKYNLEKCVRTSDGKIGWYDSVNDKFYEDENDVKYISFDYIDNCTEFVYLTNQWISIKNGNIPNLNEDVFVYFQDYYGFKRGIASLKKNVFGYVWNINMCEIPFKSVTHWMPLPNEPEMEGE